MMFLFILLLMSKKVLNLERCKCWCICYIGKLAKIGDGSIIRHHATVEGDVEMGKGNEVYPYSYIGGQTQDLKFKGGTPKLRIGDENVFREYVTAHAATNDGELTIIGSHNVFSYSHIAHDCEVGIGHNE